MNSGFKKIELKTLHIFKRLPTKYMPSQNVRNVQFKWIISEQKYLLPGSNDTLTGGT